MASQKLHSRVKAGCEEGKSNHEKGIARGKGIEHLGPRKNFSKAIMLYTCEMYTTEIGLENRQRAEG